MAESLAHFWQLPTAPDPGTPIWSVGELTQQIKERIEGYPPFQGLWVKGEISNFKHHTSGHLYFTLKDQTAALRCVLFRSRAARVSFNPGNGQQVLAFGSLAVYAAGGEYELLVDVLLPAGVGEYYLRFEALKRKLEAEGLFAAERKRPLPAFPRRVGVVTSPTGAAVRDICTVIGRRAAHVQIFLSPALVQGEQAPASLIAALQRLLPWRPDVVIIGRGGGSLEDLAAFNDEGLARAIATYPVPIISAVGHETDYTIADFVADRRAPTPSAGAELAVPDTRELRVRLEQLRRRLRATLVSGVQRRQAQLDGWLRHSWWRRPQDLVELRRQRLDSVWIPAQTRWLQQLEMLRQTLQERVAQLDSLNPLAVLRRGYALCLGEDGQVLRQVGQARVGEAVRVQVEDGQLHCEVRAVHRRESEVDPEVAAARAWLARREREETEG